MNEFAHRFADTRPCTQVSVLELQGPVSRLPRPVAGLRRSRVVSTTTSRGRNFNHVGSSFPAIDTTNDSNVVVRNVCTSNWGSADGSTINPISRLMLTSASTDRYRPKTSSSAKSALLRRKASGKSNLLHKLQTMSFERSEEDEVVVARFARFEPLPAISHPSANQEKEQSEVHGEDERTDGVVECSQVSSSSSDSSDVVVAAESDVPNPHEVGTSEQRLFESVDRSSSDVSDDDNRSVEDYGREFQREDNTHFSERPATSYLLRKNCRPLVRSQTYDILPNDDGCEATAIKKKVDGEFDDSDSVNIERSESWDGLNNLGCGSGMLLLVIRLPMNDDHIYGYFHEDDTLQTVLDYAMERMKRYETMWKIAHVDDCGDVQCLDLTKTIRETKLWNRAVLDIIE